VRASKRSAIGPNRVTRLRAKLRVKRFRRLLRVRVDTEPSAPCAREDDVLDGGSRIAFASRTGSIIVTSGRGVLRGRE
jgi:hypothetical protein